MTDELLMPEDSLLLDRLVDGELSDHERRDLLLRLERTPDGWRRCALAFLEGQEWRGGAKAHAAGAPEGKVGAATRTIPSNWKGGLPWSSFALAACLMVSLGVWVIIRDRDGNQVARVRAPDGTTATVQPQIAPSPSQSFPPSSPNMQLVVDGGPNEADEVVEVPLVGADRLNEALFGQWSQSVPRVVLQMLERSGHQVVRERQLVPVQLRDGRRVVVPMDQVEIRPVGVRGYQ
jgi:hypothetical protein